MSSPPPPVIFRRKAKPATRTRQTSPENGDTDANETAENSPSTLAIKLKNKIKKTSKTKSRLSFGGDDNDEVRVSNSLQGSTLTFWGVRRVGMGRFSRSKNRV